MKAYSKLEGEMTIEPGKYIQEYINFSGTSLDLTPVRIDYIPSIMDTERRLRKGPMRRAAGTDGICEGITQATPQEIATMPHPLLVNICLTGVEP
eukprot:6042902-Pyramimonas_sp.AAC.1